MLTLRPGNGETFRALNGSDYTVDARGLRDLPMPPACSRSAGVIGGEATGCDEATTDVFVECALFDPVASH